MLSEWAKENSRFREAYERAKQKQKSILIKGGLLNKFNSKIVTFCLMNCSDMVEKQAQTKSNNEAESVLLSIDGNSKDIVNDQK